MIEKSPHWAQCDQYKMVECTNHVLNWLPVDESRDWLGYGILPIVQITFSVEYKFSIKCNSSFWSTQNADSKYVLHIKYLQRKPYLEPINDLVVKMTTFAIEYKKWSCYTSFWSLLLADHFDTNLDSKKSPRWSLEVKIKILKIFADDVIGTGIDQKYFQ